MEEDIEGETNQVHEETRMRWSLIGIGEEIGSAITVEDLATCKGDWGTRLQDNPQ